MRRTRRILLCLCAGLTLCLILAFRSSTGQPDNAPAPGVQPDHESSRAPDGDIQVEATVVEEDIVPGGIVNGRRHKPWENWVVRFQITRVLKGRLNKSELRFVVHSPSQELGLTGGVGQRGVLHGYRTSGRYEFVPAGGR